MVSLDDYDYTLPEGKIAKYPSSPRDSARLFVYDTRTDEVAFDTFLHLDRYLPKESLLVFNDTKVVPARLYLMKETGGKIEVLLFMNEYHQGDELLKGIVDRKLSAGAKLFFRSGAWLDVVRQDEQFFFFRPSVPVDSIWKMLHDEGVTPIPPYIKGGSLKESDLREKYQSILAKYPASIAAPTASLHFTKRLLWKLGEQRIRHTEVTLHVGAGTFAPIDETNITAKKLFTEYFDITEKSAKAVEAAKHKGVKVIPVGTTALRALESAARDSANGELLARGNAATDIFIFPPFDFKVADALITNFHVPRSSLMLLVDAFLKHKGAKRNLLALYAIALKENFRFYSFGDGMLIK